MGGEGSPHIEMELTVDHGRNHDFVLNIPSGCNVPDSILSNVEMHPTFDTALIQNIKGRKEMFYLTTHSTHFIYGDMASGIYMVKDHSDSERGKQQGLFYMHHPTDRITHTTAFVTPVVEHWLEREIAQWVHHEGSIRRPIAP